MAQEHLRTYHNICLTHFHFLQFTLHLADIFLVQNKINKTQFNQFSSKIIYEINTNLVLTVTNALHFHYVIS